MTDLDVVEATRARAERLDALQLGVWAERLRAAIDTASTGGELVMGVRHHLRSLRASSDDIPQDVLKRIDEIVSAIDRSGW